MSFRRTQSQAQFMRLALFVGRADGWVDMRLLDACEVTVQTTVHGARIDDRINKPPSNTTTNSVTHHIACQTHITHHR